MNRSYTSFRTSCAPGVRPIDLVDHDDRGQPALERLAEHEPRLRQRSFRRVDQEHDPVHHRERPLDLAAEIGVARRIADVDQQVLVMDGRVLRENRDAALALEFVVVHGAFCHAFVGAERAALVQERIDQRGLAVVDVGDDGDVTAGRICYRHLSSIRGTDAPECLELTQQGAGN